MLGGKVMLEVAPPARRASGETIEKAVVDIAGLVSRLPRLDFINVPEIISENHAGEPWYLKMDNCEFGELLKKATGKEVIVNKITVHLRRETFYEWMDQAVSRYGVRHVVFVGAHNDTIHYPGLSVIEANKRAVQQGVCVGNISIPERERELERLIAKTESGCSFFATQILFEAKSIKNLLFEYDQECKKRGLTPAAFFLCFAPISDALDVDYIKWLGARIPPDVEEALKANPAEASVRLSQELYADIQRHARDPSVPLSVIVEPVSLHNLSLAETMIRNIASAQVLKTPSTPRTPTQRSE